MPLSAQDRVRQSVARKVTPDVILARYRALKGIPTARMEDITPAIMAVLVGEVIEFFSPESLNQTVTACNRVAAHTFAIAEDDAESVAAQAREDVERYGKRTVTPGCCFLCEQRIEPLDAYVLHLSATFRADVHGSCAQADARCELLSSFAFRWNGGSR